MAELKIKADSGGGTVSFKGPSTTTSNAAVQLTLPVDDGTANQYLKTDGSGALSWATVDTSIADDSLTEAKLDIHAAPSGTDKFLGYTSNGMEWAVPGGGKVLQYVYNSSTTNVTSTGSEHVIVDASITPSATSNKIFIIGNATIGSNSNSNSYGGGRIRRGDVSGTMLSEYSFGHSISNNTEDHVTPWVVDSTHNTSGSAVTYSFTMSRWSSSTTSAIAYGTAGGGIKIFLVELEG